jgi:hypothetical protein
LLNITEITYASPQNVTALYQEQIDAMLERLLKRSLAHTPIPYQHKTPQFSILKEALIYQEI